MSVRRLQILITILCLMALTSLTGAVQPIQGQPGQQISERLHLPWLSRWTPPQPAEPSADWVSVYPGDRASTLRAAWISPEGVAFVAGDRGVIRRQAPGQPWQAMDSGSQLNFKSFWGTGERDIYLVGDEGTILHYDGRLWVKMLSGTSEHLIAAWGLGRDQVFAAGYGGTILRFDGRRWQPMDSGTEADFVDLWAAGPSAVFAVEKDGVHRFDGVGWSRMEGSPGSISKIWGLAEDDLYVLGRSIHHFDGVQWTRLPDPPESGSSFFSQIGGTASDDLIVIGSISCPRCNAVYVAEYDGQDWTMEMTQISHGFLDLWASADHGALGVGYAGQIIRRDPEWRFEVHSIGDRENMRDVWGLSREAFIAAMGHRLVRFDGREWKGLEAPVGGVDALWGFAADDWIAATDHGLQHFDGETWRVQDLDVPAPEIGFSEIWADGPNLIFAAGYHSGFGPYVLWYNGSRWQFTEGVTEPMKAIWGLDAENAFAVSEEQLWRYDGRRWSEIDARYQARFRSVWAQDRKTVLAGGAEGLLVRWDGERAEELESGTTLTLRDMWGSPGGDVYMAAGSSFIGPGSGAILRFDGRTVVQESIEDSEPAALNAIWGAPDGTIFAAGNSGTIYRRVRGVEPEGSARSWKEHNRGVVEALWMQVYVQPN